MAFPALTNNLKSWAVECLVFVRGILALMLEKTATMHLTCISRQKYISPSRLLENMTFLDLAGKVAQKYILGTITSAFKSWGPGETKSMVVLEFDGLSDIVGKVAQKYSFWTKNIAFKSWGPGEAKSRITLRFEDF